MRDNDSLDFRTLDPGLSIENERLLDVYALWRGRCHDEMLPSRGDFDATDLMRFGGIIALIEGSSNPERFRFRLVGSEITRVLGRDSTGRFLDELYGEKTYDTAVAGYRYCVDHKKPVRAVGRMVHANTDALPFESIDFPLSTNGVDVDMIMKAAVVGRISRDPWVC
jgi:hypothetical protein